VEALVNTVLNLRVPQNVGKFLGSCPAGGFSRRTQLHGDIQLLIYTSIVPPTSLTSTAVFLQLLVSVLLLAVSFVHHG
jgi:hypothetical protein